MMKTVSKLDDSGFGTAVLVKSASLCAGDLVEINTNLVLFCFFKPAEDRPSQERCLILKFLHTRLLTQSEQFANELTRHLDICAPNCRILRQKVSMGMRWAAASLMIAQWHGHFFS